jgi:glutathione synthase/RimK-type ligase-like ATP-grasp enzyme
MLDSRGMVYVKPVTGSLGIGVMKIEKLQGSWLVQDGRTRRAYSSYTSLYKWLRKRINGKPYMVQRGIRMLKDQGRPIDFRVMIQKGRKNGWKVTGVAARVAHPRLAVTNGSQGGSIHGARSILKRTAGSDNASRLLKKFNYLAHLTARELGNVYPRMQELGLDIAVDNKHRSWILEVNTKPDPCPFTKLDDTSMLREIVRYARGYGKTYELKCMKARRGGG